MPDMAMDVSTAGSPALSPISKKDKSGLAVCGNRMLPSFTMLIYIQVMVRRIWLTMVLGDDTSGPLPHYFVPDAGRIDAKGEKLFTPNWLTRSSGTNDILIDQVMQKTKLLSVSAVRVPLASAVLISITAHTASHIGLGY